MSLFVGQAVRNNDFWDRTNELEDIWDAIFLYLLPEE